MALFVNLLPLRVVLEGFPGCLGGFAAGEGDQVDERRAFAVLLVEGRPEADQLGSVLLQKRAGVVAEAFVQVVELPFIQVVSAKLENAVFSVAGD